MVHKKEWMQGAPHHCSKLNPDLNLRAWQEQQQPASNPRMTAPAWQEQRRLH
eukprot:gene12648-4915_t